MQKKKENWVSDDKNPGHLLWERTRYPVGYLVFNSIGS